MLKKLAKYGNSTTLVIDKAILELLNMNESSMVKLHTDGKSLIITPVEVAPKEAKVSYEAAEAFKAAGEALAKKNPYSVPVLDLGSEKTLAMMREYQLVQAKYPGLMARFAFEMQTHEEFNAAVKTLNEQIDPEKNPEEYIKEHTKLTHQFWPELVDLQNDMAEIQKKYSGQETNA